MKIKLIIFAPLRIGFIAIALALSVATASAQESLYKNPVVSGDYPDPSVIRVGQDYWATATSGEWAPFFPILHSRDLVSWEVVSAVFRDRPSWSVRNFWAPEIVEDRGRYFIYYTARKKRGPLCIAVATSISPSGPYTDHGPLVCQESGSIDAFAERDENNRLYLIWKEDGNSRNLPTKIWAQQLSDDGIRVVGKKKELMRNDNAWEHHVIEGPFILRHNDWFYMFYSGNACCGRECNYALGVARSRSLLGPYEKNPGNPILAANEAWKCPGHGSIVSDGRARAFLLYHAYRSSSDSVHIGREALLDEVKWGEDGWPTINEGRGPSKEAPPPLGYQGPAKDASFFDDFTSRTLHPSWQWPQAAPPSVRFDAQGNLMLSPNKKPSKGLAVALLAQPTRAGDYVAETLVDTGALVRGAQAGLASIQDQQNGVGIVISEDKIRLWRRERGADSIIASVPRPRTTSVYLRISATGGKMLQFTFSGNGQDWTNVGGEVNASTLEGIRIALTSGGSKRASAKFDWLRITPARTAGS